MIRGFLRILLFLWLGPFIGLIGAGIAIGISTLVTTGSFRDFTFGPELLSPAILTVTYTLGLLPALLTAIVSIVLAPRMSGWRHWLWLALSGGIISLILGWIVFGPVGAGGGFMPGVFTFVIGAAGALAGLICGMLFDGFATLLGRR